MIAAPPLDPDGATGRDWLRQELAKAAYSPRRDLLGELEDWFYGHILRPLLRNASTAPGLLLTILLVVLAVVVCVALLRFRARRRQPVPEWAGAVLDSALTAAQLRERAAAAAASGDFTAAYLDYFRAIARGGQERVVITTDPGATAHELASALGAVFPAEADPLRAAAGSFDVFRYGEVSAADVDVAGVRELEARLRASRPVVAA